jgi:hypothetical protein
MYIAVFEGLRSVGSQRSAVKSMDSANLEP